MNSSRGTRSAAPRTVERITDFLGSAHVFSQSVNDIVEKQLLRDVAGKTISFPQLKLLQLVALTDSHTLGEVAAFLGVTSAAASKAVDKLVRRNLLRRAEEKADRRAVRLSLTEAGRRLLDAYEAARNRKLLKVFREFPASDLARVSDLLDRLSIGIVNHHGKPEQTCLQCGIYFRKRCLVRELLRRRCYYQRHREARCAPPGQSGKGPTHLQTGSSAHRVSARAGAWR